MFGLPFVFSQAGFGLGLTYLLLLTATVLTTMLALAEVSMRTPATHQLPGYAKLYVGKVGEVLMTVSIVFGIYGALTAYILGEGLFLHSLLNPWFGGQPVYYSLVFWVTVSAALAIGIKRILKTEAVLVVLLLLVVFLIVWLSVPYIDFAHLSQFVRPITGALSWRSIFIPFGVVLFALGAATAIPENVQFLRQMKATRFLKPSIVVGMLVPACVYLFFVIAVVGVSGPDTAENPILGIGHAIGGHVVVIGSMLGVLTMVTSFLALSLALQDQFHFDFSFSKLLSWSVVVFPPMCIVLLGFGSFIDFLGIAGSLVGGLDGILILWMYLKVQNLPGKRTLHIAIPRPLVFVCMFVYALGICSEIITVAGKFFSS